MAIWLRGEFSSGADNKVDVLSNLSEMLFLRIRFLVELERNCWGIFLEKSLSGDGLNGGQGYLTEILVPELFF